MKKRITLVIFLICFQLVLLPCLALAVKVVVDPGHGGSDPGAIGVNGLYEKNVNLDISLKLKEELIKKGYEVAMTRESDRYVSLKDRVRFTNEAKADLFVSVHANSHPSSSAKGTLVLYYDDAYPQKAYPASEAMKKLTPQSKQLAKSVLSALVKEIGTENKGIVPNAAYVIRMGSVPSILVETAFLSNRSDAALLADEKARRLIARGIANGIEAFRPVIFSDVAGHWAYPYIARLKEKGVVQGYNNMFRPEQPLTRAELLTMLDRIVPFPDNGTDEASAPELPDNGTDEVSSTELPVSDTNEASASDLPVSGTNEASAPVQPVNNADEVPAPDLPENHWAYGTFKKALKLGIINGYPDGTVKPDQAITRAEVSAILDRLLNGKDAPPSLPDQIGTLFDDVPLDMWCAPAVYRLKEASIVTGMTNSTFAPNRLMTRAEAAVMMDRYMTKVSDK